jgi:hypothetical protein
MLLFENGDDDGGGGGGGAVTSMKSGSIILRAAAALVPPRAATQLPLPLETTLQPLVLALPLMGAAAARGDDARVLLRKGMQDSSKDLDASMSGRRPLRGEVEASLRIISMRKRCSNLLLLLLLLLLDSIANAGKIYNNHFKYNVLKERGKRRD